VPRCYLLTLCSGSSLDQHSNNVTLFNLVEQLNVPPGAPPPPGGIVPLEIHAYWQLAPLEIGEPFEVRYALVASTGLETVSDVLHHKSVTPRYRTRTLGMPFPPVTGQYELRVDWRSAGADWQRESIAWPLTIVEHNPQPIVTH
jgi:hypothetical protein